MSAGASTALPRPRKKVPPPSYSPGSLSAIVNESKLCSASQDLVFIVDVSFSRKFEQDEYREFLLNFSAQFELDGGGGGRAPVPGLELPIAE